MKAAHYLIPLLLLGFLFSSCRSQVEHSVSYSSEILEEHAFVSPLSIFYASNRLPSGKEAAADYFSTQRGGDIYVGQAYAAMKNPGLDWSDISRTFKHRAQDYLFPFALQDLTQYGTLSLQQTDRPANSGDRQWLEAIDRQMEQSGVPEVYIYIHGYYESFDAPVLTGLDLWRSMGCKGALVAYSWPTLEKASAYAGDLDSSIASARLFREMVEVIKKETRVEKVHIMAHSAGTRLLVQALLQWRLSKDYLPPEEIKEDTGLGQVILAASDMDPYVFWNALEDGILDTLDNLTVYTSNKDRVLRRSRLVHSYSRLGEARTYNSTLPEFQDYIFNDSRLDIIDVRNVKNVHYWTGHYYFMGSPWVYRDIHTLWTKGEDPQERGLLRNIHNGLWYFPKDYEERLDGTE